MIFFPGERINFSVLDGFWAPLQIQIREIYTPLGWFQSFPCQAYKWACFQSSTTVLSLWIWTRLQLNKCHH